MVWVTQKLGTYMYGFILSLALTVASSAMAEIRIGIVFDKGGKDDRSFNSSAYEGIMRAKAKLHVFVKYVEATDDNSYEPLLRAFVRRQYDLIIGVGFSQKTAIQRVAHEFPKLRFAIVDANVNEPNVRSLIFAEHEGAYLVGAIAGLTSKTGRVGFIGGMDVPMMRRFELGFRAGVQKVNPLAKITANFVGVTVDAWNNPPKAKELALTQYGGGIDVIFGAAGASEAGIFDAAEDKKLLAIGVDSNQNWIKPGLILTSMLKRIDVAVFSACEDVVKGTFTGGIKEYSIANGGVDYAIDVHNEKILLPRIRTRVEAIRQQIITGNIHVPDYYQKSQ